MVWMRYRSHYLPADWHAPAQRAARAARLRWLGRDPARGRDVRATAAQSSEGRSRLAVLTKIDCRECAILCHEQEAFTFE